MNLTDAQRKRLDKVVRVLLEGAPAIIEYIEELEGKLEEATQELKEILDVRSSELTSSQKQSLQNVIDRIDALQLEKGEPGESIVGPQGPKGDKGDTVIVEKVIEIQKTEVIHEQPIVTEIIKEVAVHETADELKEKIELEAAIENIRQEFQKKIDALLKGKTSGATRGFQLYTTGTKRGMLNALNIIGATYSKTNGLDTLTIGSGFAKLDATGTVNGTNTSFTFTSAPSIVVVDQGRQMQKVSSDGTVNWTGTTTITLSIAPNFDIYAY